MSDDIRAMFGFLSLKDVPGEAIAGQCDDLLHEGDGVRCGGVALRHDRDREVRVRARDRPGRPRWCLVPSLVIGAERYERAATRVTQRNGSRFRD